MVNRPGLHSHKQKLHHHFYVSPHDGSGACFVNVNPTLNSCVTGLYDSTGAAAGLHEISPQLYKKPQRDLRQ